MKNFEIQVVFCKDAILYFARVEQEHASENHAGPQNNYIYSYLVAGPQTVDCKFNYFLKIFKNEECVTTRYKKKFSKKKL